MPDITDVPAERGPACPFCGRTGFGHSCTWTNTDQLEHPCWPRIETVAEAITEALRSQRWFVVDDDGNDVLYHRAAPVLARAAAAATGWPDGYVGRWPD